MPKIHRHPQYVRLHRNLQGRPCFRTGYRHGYAVYGHLLLGADHRVRRAEPDPYRHCRRFTDELALGDIFVALAASTDSNYQHAFDLPGQYSPSASWALLTKALAASSDTGIPFKAGNVVTCDVFYEFGDWWKKWAKMGVQAVEMETAALYMNAAYNHVNALVDDLHQQTTL